MMILGLSQIKSDGGEIMPRTCPRCHGDGKIDCPRCNGSGEIIGILENYDCARCDGSGSIDCPRCDGSGEIDD